MRVNRPFDSDGSQGSKALAMVPRRCEKASPSNGLNGKQRDARGGNQSSLTAVQLETVSQSETLRFDPFWDGPRLLPTFVAQVIGQAIPDRRDHGVSLQTAYGSIDCPRKALVLDRRS
jgi:hypothetical protein